MKKLGLIGGIGPESTIAYYHDIAYGVHERADVYPNLAIESLNVFDVLRLCGAGDYDGLAEYVLKGLRCLSGAGADFAALTGITPHIVFDELSTRSPIPLVSIIDAACAYSLERGYTKVALLGTYPTMSGSFFQEVFARKGIEVVTPLPDEMEYIGEKISSELENGKIVPSTRERVAAIAERMTEENGVQAIVLGCTELPMLFGNTRLQVPFIDVMRVHIDVLIDMILAD